MNLLENFHDENSRSESGVNPEDSPENDDSEKN
jgi:hypothetical protein